MHGLPGVGKGEAACWALGRLLHEGHRPLIIDWEHRQREWSMRLAAIGVDVDYVDFEAVHVKDRQIAQTLIDLVDGYDVVVWDSASASRPPAKANDTGQEEAARATIRVIRQFGIPVLLIAHENKANTRGSVRTAYGSVAWMAEARLAWHADRKPGSVVLKLVCTKSNDVEPIPMSFRFVNGRLERSIEPTITEREQEKAETLSTRIVDILRKRGRSLSMAEIRDAWVQDYDESVPARLRVRVSEMVGSVLVRMGENRSSRYWLMEDEQDELV